MQNIDWKTCASFQNERVFKNIDFCPQLDTIEMNHASGWHGLFPVVVGKVCEHYTGKTVNSAANLYIATLNKIATHTCSKLWCYDGQLSI